MQNFKEHALEIQLKKRKQTSAALRTALTGSHYRPTLLEQPLARSMFAGTLSSSSKSSPYQNTSRNKVSVIYIHYNYIKTLNNLFSPKSDQHSKAMGVNKSAGSTAGEEATSHPPTMCSSYYPNKAKSNNH
jgi:hypothetical protein